MNGGHRCEVKIFKSNLSGYTPMVDDVVWDHGAASSSLATPTFGSIV